MTRQRRGSKSRGKAKEKRKTASGSRRKRNAILPSKTSLCGKHAPVLVTDAQTCNQTNKLGLGACRVIPFWEFELFCMITSIIMELHNVTNR
mmetsp:Transcript_28351/g.59388  ORF Transcript_28351/g.59388 Transcript_28351/m.59388 type:complete len:92 (+) Transcript_28351:2225-2500(+)